MIQPKGIVPPIVTPMLSHEVHGIFVLGTTGECYSLDEGERQKIIATAVAPIDVRDRIACGIAVRRGAFLLQ